MQLPDTRDGNRKVKLADRSEHNNVYAKFAVIALVNYSNVLTRSSNTKIW